MHSNSLIEKNEHLGAFAPLFDKYLPHILEQIFFYLDYDTYTKCSKVCTTWAKLHSSEIYCKKLRQKYLEKIEDDWTWEKNDYEAKWTTYRSYWPQCDYCEDCLGMPELGISIKLPMLKISERGHCAHFHPCHSLGTAAARSTRPLTKGKHYWEITVSDRKEEAPFRGIMFGIGTAKTPLKFPHGWFNLLGENQHSWGLCHRGFLYHHEHDHFHPCCYYQRYCESIPTTGDVTIGMYYNGIDGTLEYYRNGVSLGIAFYELNEVKEPLYPMISSTENVKMKLGVKKKDFQEIFSWLN